MLEKHYSDSGFLTRNCGGQNEVVHFSNVEINELSTHNVISSENSFQG
jgi:hypothetical protein